MHHFAQMLVNSVIVNTGQVVGHLAITPVVIEQSHHVRLDLGKAVLLLVVGHEQVGVDFVDEDFVV